jgi:hypothetical protein
VTEAEWLACTDPMPMLEFLRGKVSDRKLRLFAVGCCRRVWHLLVDERSRKEVEVAERFADGLADRRELEKAIRSDSVWDSKLMLAREMDAAEAVGWAAWDWNALNVPTPETATYGVDESLLAARNAARAMGWDASSSPRAPSSSRAEQTCQCLILRDIIGNPFRPVTIDTAWLRWNFATVPAIARHVYEDRAFHDLPILADALGDAGCTDQVILTHCRQRGEHIRGCWVVDLLLGKG